MAISPNALISSALLAAPPAFIIFSSILHRYCYCGPRIEPGRAILIHPMKSAGGKPICFIIYNAIKLPVRPKPALQCTAIAPFSASQAAKNLSTIGSLGAEPSKKYRSRCFIPFLTNLYLSYWSLLSLMTSVTPNFLKIGT
jgi:hypothetical protein